MYICVNVLPYNEIKCYFSKINEKNAEFERQQEGKYGSSWRGKRKWEMM